MKFIAKKFPERESDEFDAGYAQAIEDVNEELERYVKQGLLPNIEICPK